MTERVTRGAMRTMLAAGLLCGVAGMASAAEISGEVVRIGVMNDQSGAYADTSGPGSAAAARLAVEDFGGTVLGKPIEIVSADHQNKPDIGAGTARRWYDQDGVDGIFDIANSAVSLAVQELAKSDGRLVVHVGSANDRIYGQDCAATGFLWLYDTFSIAQAIGKAVVAQGGDSWYYISADYAFAKAMEGALTPVVEAAGGKVLGAARHPIGTTDYSSYVLQAQASGAKVVALANAGVDTINTIKQASEFGLTQGGQKLAATVFYLHTVHGLGLEVAQGLQVVTGFYWNMDDGTRAFAKRFEAATNGNMPSQIHAGTYSAVLHYLKAVDAAGTDEPRAVAAKMRDLRVNDFFTRDAEVRRDGRLMRDYHLVEVKTPAESTGPWDYYKVLDRVPAADVIRPMDPALCPILK
ncbi:ABC transporter substrate-binding protein [Tistrella mobilis]|uniref:ABC transporter substrate-binding protein n=1 Tax=Tistrella mobilis TaxID=171437 RepID=UPI00355875C1